MKIIANHAHLMPENSWKPGDAGLLLKYLDYCGIDQAVVFPPFACQYGNNLEQANRWALGQVRQHPDRFLPAGTLFPLAPDAINLLRMLAQEGVKVVKIHPSIDLHDVGDPACRRFYAEAERLNLVLDYHTGPHGTRLSLATPEKFDDLAWDFPNLRLVLEHLGGRAYFEMMLAIIASHKLREQDNLPQVYAGLTSVLDRQVNKAWYLGAERIVDAIEIVGAHKFIFGLDFPWNDMECGRRVIQLIQGFNIPQEDKEKILGGNLLRMLGEPVKV